MLDSGQETVVSGNGNGDGAVGTLPKPTDLDDARPVVSTNGTGFPVPEKLPEHTHRFFFPPKLKLLFVAVFRFGSVAFSLWLAIPWIEELGKSITVPIPA